MKNIKLLLIIYCVFLSFVSCSSKEHKIFEYIKKNDIKNVEKLIKKSPDLVNVKDKDLSTPLHYTCNRGYIKLSKLLIENGALVNAVNIVNYTPIYNAVDFFIQNDGTLDMLSLLIKNGANVYDKKNNSILQNMLHLFEYEEIDLKKLDNLIDFFLKNKLSLNSQNNFGDTILHTLAGNYTMNFDSFKLLIKKDANINLKNNKGMTVLHEYLLNKNSNLDITKFLVNNGAKLNEPDNEGNTPLFYALRSALPYPEKIKYLLDKGADPKVINKKGENASHILSNNVAVNYDEVIDITNLLIAKGVDIKQKDKNGKLPFSRYIKKKDDYKKDKEFYEFLNKIEAMQK